MATIMVYEEGRERMTLKSCPYLRNCEVPLPENYFETICNFHSYVKCFHFSRRAEKSMTPAMWLQKLAVQKSKMPGMENTSMPLSDFMGDRNEAA